MEFKTTDQQQQVQQVQRLRGWSTRLPGAKDTFKFGERAFCISGPLVWNSLHESLQTVDKVTTFRRRLKTHFFNIYLTWFYIHCFGF